MKKGKVRLLNLLLVFAMLLTLLPSVRAKAAENVEVTVTASVVSGREMLEPLNEWRASSPGHKSSSGENVTDGDDTYELEYNYDLEAIALQRAAEISASFSHTRPDGSSWSSCTVNGTSSNGENIAAGPASLGYDTYSGPFEAWKEENEDYENQGHRRNMLGTPFDFKQIGIACVEVDGVYYWVQEFSTDEAESSETELPETQDFTIEISSSQVGNSSLQFKGTDGSWQDESSFALSVGVNRTKEISFDDVRMNLGLTDAWPEDVTVVIPGSSLVWESDGAYASVTKDETSEVFKVEGLQKGTQSSTVYAGSSSTGIFKGYNNLKVLGVKSIAIETKPSVNTYLAGTSAIDTTDGKIKVTYEDDSTETVDLSEADSITFDAASPGQKEATVTYGGKTATFDYLVIGEQTAKAVYGDHLSAVSIPKLEQGTFAWEGDTTRDVGTVTSPRAGLTATFTPSDPAKFSSLSGVPVKLTVQKATPEVTNPLEASVLYGKTLADVDLSAYTNSIGSYVFEQDPSTSVGGPGVNSTSFTAKFVPDDTENYKSVTGILVTLTVNKAPEIRINSLAGTAYGESYSAKVEADGYPAPSFSVTSEDQSVMEEFGFTLNADGTITGTAKKAGECAISVYAKNGIDPDAVQVLTIPVSKADIPSAAVTVPAPVKGQSPAQVDAVRAGDSSYAVTSVSWDPAEDPFKPGESYTFTVELEADSNHAFSAGTVFTINGEQARVVSANETEAVISFYFQHAHDIAKMEQKDPTCTEAGTRAYWYCKDCSKIFSDEAGTEEVTLSELSLDALGHDYSTAWSSDGTSHWHACTLCGSRSEEAAHEYGEWVHTQSHIRTCQVCGYAQHEECQYGEWVVTKPATETENGLRERTCAKCQNKQTEVIPKTGSPAKASTDSNVPATGDSSLTVVWILSFVFAAAVLTAAIRRRKETR